MILKPQYLLDTNIISEMVRNPHGEIKNIIAEKDKRQLLLDEELIKAEAQIELIKDILLREKAF